MDSFVIAGKHAQISAASVPQAAPFSVESLKLERCTRGSYYAPAVRGREHASSAVVVCSDRPNAAARSATGGRRPTG
jgi:hypothetical protein